MSSWASVASCVTRHERHRAKELGWQLHEDEDGDVDAGEDDDLSSVLDVEEILLGDYNHWHIPSSSKQMISDKTTKKTLHFLSPTRNQHTRMLSIQSLLNEPAPDYVTTESRA